MTPQELSDRLWQFAARIAPVLDEAEQLARILGKSLDTARNTRRPPAPI
jgi:hypothetical protein